MEPYFEAILVSSENSDSFAHNSSFSFSNYLPRQIDLADYEVALNYISFYDNLKPEKPQIPNSTAVQVAGESYKFFDISKNEHEITTETILKNEIAIGKLATKWDNFVELLNTTLQREGFKFRVSKTFVLGETLKEKIDAVRLSYFGEEGWELQIGDKLARILGFTETRFPPATYVNDLKPDIDYFETLESTETIANIVEYKITKENLFLEQFDEKPDAFALTNELVRVLEENEIESSFRVKQSDSAIQFDLGLVVKLKLSEFLNEYLGLDKNFVFFGEGSISIPSELIYPTPIISATESTLPFDDEQEQKGTKVLVTCDILAPQCFAGKESQVLLILDRITSDTAQQISYRANPLVFKSLVPEKRAHIQIGLVTDKFESLRLTDKPTFVSLYFRQKSLI